MNTDAAQPELRHINTMLRFQATKLLGTWVGTWSAKRTIGHPADQELRIRHVPFGGQHGYFWYTLGGPRLKGAKLGRW